MDSSRETQDTSHSTMPRSQSSDASRPSQLIGSTSEKPANEAANEAITITQYLLKESAEFRRVSELREKGWKNPDGDTYFKDRRQNADNVTKQMAKVFFEQMKKNGEDLHHSTNAFEISATRPKILDMGMAPGGFLATALRKNPRAEALAFSLPVSKGGYKVLLPPSPNVVKKFLDITMLAEDMGSDMIPTNHPDAGHFLPRQFDPDQLFDLVLCGGSVVRTHERASYREGRGGQRLIVSQLSLGMEHLRPGGTMIVLLHKPENFHTANLLRTFSKFSSVRPFKPEKGHNIRSSFYMVATNVQSQHVDAIKAVKDWKASWKVATFGTDEEYEQSVRYDGESVEALLAEFGVDLVSLGRQVWKVQADALSKASFIKN